jgi:hypothetical protein
MAGFPLLNIGTGLTGFMGGFQQAQQQAQQKAMNDLRMQMYQQAMQDDQQKRQAQANAFTALLGLGGQQPIQNAPMPGQGSVPGGGGGYTQAPPFPTTPVAPPVQGGDTGFDPTPSGAASMQPPAPDSTGEGTMAGLPPTPAPASSSQPSYMRDPGYMGSGADIKPPTPSGGGGDTRDYITQGSRSRGIDPNLSLAVVGTEGGWNQFKVGDSGSSGGPFQLHLDDPRRPGAGNSMGDQFFRKTGLNPLDPKNERATIDYALDYAAAHGNRFDPNIWHGTRSLPGQGSSGGGTQYAGAGVSDTGGGGERHTTGYARQIPPEQQASSTANSIMRQAPGGAWGRTSINTLAQAIEKANPGASPAVKFMALQEASKLLVPEERMQMQEFMRDRQEDFRRELKEFDERNRREREEERRTYDERIKGLTNLKPERLSDRDGNPIFQVPSKTPGGLPTFKNAAGEDIPPDQLQGVTKTGTAAKVSPEMQAMHKFLQENPDAGSAQIAAFMQSTKGSRSPQQLVMQKWLGEHPEAKSEDALRELGRMRREQSIATAFGGGTAATNVTALNTVTDHLDVLQEAAVALGNGDVQVLNTLKNKFQTQIGSPIPTNFEQAKRIASNEIARATIGGVGGVTDREEINKLINQAESPEQLAGAIAQGKRLIAGRLRSLRRQYAGNDPEKNKQFDEEMLSPLARAELGGLPPEGGAAGVANPPSGVGGDLPTVSDQAAYDALPKGARYKGPDGKEYQKGQ